MRHPPDFRINAGFWCSYYLDYTNFGECGGDLLRRIQFVDLNHRGIILPHYIQNHPRSQPKATDEGITVFHILNVCLLIAIDLIRLFPGIGQMVVKLVLTLVCLMDKSGIRASLSIPSVGGSDIALPQILQHIHPESLLFLAPRALCCPWSVFLVSRIRRSGGC